MGNETSSVEFTQTELYKELRRDCMRRVMDAYRWADEDSGADIRAALDDFGTKILELAVKYGD